MYFYDYINMIGRTHKPISYKLRLALDRVPHYIETYDLNEAYVQALIDFIQNNLYLQKGGHLPFILEPEQKFWIEMLGYEHKTTHVPVISDLGIIIGAGSGKSTFMAALSLAVMMVGSYKGNDVLVLSNSKEQSQELFRTASEMCSDDSSPLMILKNNYLLRPVINKIYYDPTNSIMQIKAMDNRTADGVNVRMAVFDEFHAYKVNVIENIRKSSAPKRAKTGFTIVFISTNGQTRDLVFDDYMKTWEKLLYDGERLRLGIIKPEDAYIDDSTFPLIYQYDNGCVDIYARDLPNESIEDVNSYEMAMPFIKTISDPQIILDTVRKMHDNPVGMSEILAKSFNIPQSEFNNLFTAETLLKCYKPESYLSPERDVYIGYDMSAVDDLSSITIALKDDHYYRFENHNFIPRSTYEKRTDEKHRQLYDKFIDEGSLTIMDSDTIDYDQAFDWMYNYLNEQHYSVIKIFGDAFYATQFRKRCIETYGEDNVIELRQSVRYLSEPLKFIRGLVTNESVELSNALLVWSFGNVKVKVDANDNIYPNKEKKADKIDPVLASIQAIYGFITQVEDDVIDWGKI